MSEAKAEEKAPEPVHTKPHDTGPLPVFAMVFAFLIPPVGLVLSAIGLAHIKKGEEHHGMVVASTVISSIFTFFWVIMIVLYIAIIGFVFNGLLSPNGFIQQSIKQEEEHHQLQVTGARDVSDDFMQAIKDKDYPGAYLLLSKNAKSDTGDVVAFQKSLANKDIKSYRLDDPQKASDNYYHSSNSTSGNYHYSSSSSSSSTAPNNYTVSGTIIYTDGKSGTVSLTVLDTSSDQTSTNFVVDSFKITKD